MKSSGSFLTRSSSSRMMLADVSASALGDLSTCASPAPVRAVGGGLERHQPPHPPATSNSAQAAKSAHIFLENGKPKPLLLPPRPEILRNKVFISHVNFSLHIE